MFDLRLFSWKDFPFKSLLSAACKSNQRFAAASVAFRQPIPSPRPIKTLKFRPVIVLMFYRVFNLKYIITSEPAGVLLSVGSAQRAIPFAHKEQS